MKALTYDHYGPPDVVQVADLPTPDPAPDEVLIRVHASAVNTSDWRIRAAAFPGITALPARVIFGLRRPRNRRLGSEFAGVVDAVGAHVTRFTPRQRVFGITAKGGASAEYLTIPQSGAITELPDGLSFVHAAALPFGGLAALVFLEQFANLRADQRVLIVGASGGVGAYAVQIAAALRAHVTGVSGPGSQDFVKDLGADVTINYRATDLRDINNRFDVILDTVGTVSPYLSRQLLSPGGLFLPLNIGLRALGAAFLNPFRSRKIKLTVNPNTSQDLQRLAQMVQDRTVKPVVDTVYPLDQAATAHAHVEARHRKGAIILSILPEAGGSALANWQGTRGICPNGQVRELSNV